MALSNKQIGDYIVDREIGQGGMATIYRATDTRDNRVVALKVLMPHWARDLMVLRRFQKESENAQFLQHPNIAKVYDAGQADGQHFIVMQYAGNGSLDRLLQQRRKQQKTPMAVEEVIAYLRPVAAALDYAHSQGILHRDIKPSNVLIDDDEQMLLTDFGVARRMDPTVTQLTMTSQTVGTPAYMSPEQVEGDHEIDANADIYSMGVMAYEMLTNELPFTAATATRLLQKILDEPPAAPETFNPRMVPGVTFALRKVLAKDPHSRYPSSSEFLNALERGLTWSPRPSDWATLTTGSLAAATSSRKFIAPLEERRPNRRRWVGALLALIGVVAIAFAAYSLGRQRPGPTTPVAEGDSDDQATVMVAVTSTQNDDSVALNPTVTPTEPSAQTNNPTATAAVPTDSATEPANTGDGDNAADVTSTPVPTSSPVPSPTPNLQATTAAQQAQAQTVTAVAILATSVAQTAIPTPLPITSTPLSTSTPTSAATVTPIPNTPTPIVTSTPTSTATSTPIPNTPTPTATATATPIPNTVTSTRIPIVAPDQRIVQLLSPQPNDVAEFAQPKRMLLFKWQVVNVVPKGYCTELVFKFNDQIYTLKDVTGQTQADIDLNMVASVLKLNAGNDWFDWGVRVVPCGVGGKIKPHEWRRFRYAL